MTKKKLTINRTCQRVVLSTSSHQGASRSRAILTLILTRTYLGPDPDYRGAPGAARPPAGQEHRDEFDRFDAPNMCHDIYSTSPSWSQSWRDIVRQREDPQHESFRRQNLMVLVTRTELLDGTSSFSLFPPPMQRIATRPRGPWKCAGQGEINVNCTTRSYGQKERIPALAASYVRLSTHKTHL